MRTLQSRWHRDLRPRVRGQWWLITREKKDDAPNRAYIEAEAGQWVLYVWDKHPDGIRLDWIRHAEGTDLRALKAVGRLAASQRLGV